MCCGLTSVGYLVVVCVCFGGCVVVLLDAMNKAFDIG